MHMPLSTTNYRLLIAFLAVATLAPTGCRSTRSGLSSIPGMSWIGPKDDTELASWSETSEPDLPTPSQGATPQLATHGTTSPSTGRDATSLAGGSPATAESSEVPASYPDTGFPSPYGDDRPAPSRSYATGRYDQLSPQHKAGDAAVQPTDVAPQRGFYGDEYDDVAASTSSSGATSRSSDDFSFDQPSNSTASRYEEDYGTSRYATAETDGGYESGAYGQDSNSNSNSSNSGSYYGEGSQPSRYASGNSWAEDASQEFEQAGRQQADRTAETTDRYAAGTDDWADSDLSPPSESANPLEQVSRDFKDSVGRAGQGIKDRWSQETEQIARDGKELVGDVGGKFRDVADQIQQQADDAGSRLKNAYDELGTEGTNASDYAQEGLHHGQALAAQAAQGAEKLESSWNQNAGQDGARYASPAAGASNEYGANAGIDSSPSGSSTLRRSANPWQPGSTGRYPAGNSDQSRASGGYDRQVAPATYTDEPVSNRFSPTYR